jgi:hypothetical protein
MCTSGEAYCLNPFIRQCLRAFLPVQNKVSISMKMLHLIRPGKPVYVARQWTRNLDSPQCSRRFVCPGRPLRIAGRGISVSGRRKPESNRAGNVSPPNHRIHHRPQHQRDRPADRRIAVASEQRDQTHHHRCSHHVSQSQTSAGN